MSRRFNCVDRELVELAIDLIASGASDEYALSAAAQRLRDAGRKGVRFGHVLKLESEVAPRQRLGPDSRVSSLRRLLAEMGTK